MFYLGQITRHNNKANHLDPKSRSLELFLGFLSGTQSGIAARHSRSSSPVSRGGTDMSAGKSQPDCATGGRQLRSMCSWPVEGNGKQEGSRKGTSSAPHHMSRLESEPSQQQTASPQPPTTTTAGPLEVRQRLYRNRWLCFVANIAIPNGIHETIPT